MYIRANSCKVGGARANIYQETRERGGFSSFRQDSFPSVGEGPRWWMWYGRGRGGEGTGREEVFRDEDTGRAWEWRAVKDNRRPVKGSEEQDAMLVPRRVAVFWCGALIGRQTGWIFDLRCWCAPNDTRLPSSADFDPCCSSVRPLP